METNTCRGGKLSDGKSDKLEPLSPLDLSKVSNFSDLAHGMKKTAFGGRSLGEAVDVFEAMVKDKDCYVVLTLSGAMTMAKMGLIVCDMIDKKMVHAVVSTGALMAHGFVESAGRTHFKYKEGMDDSELYCKGYNRVYDTLELEKNLDDLQEITDKVLEKLDHKKPVCSYLLNQHFGKYLNDNFKGRGILKSAHNMGVPVYIPAYTDSEMGFELGIYNRKRKIAGKEPIPFNPFLDLEDYTERIRKAKRIGIFTIGGGVPRNWAQQVGCYLDVIEKRVGEGGQFKRFNYGVRICPEPVHWGGLSGCTYSEGVSWGKFVPKEEGGMWAEVLCDATIAWPIVVKAVMERMDKK
jgi:deoxyhypusine synthase